VAEHLFAEIDQGVGGLLVGSWVLQPEDDEQQVQGVEQDRQRLCIFRLWSVFGSGYKIEEEGEHTASDGDR